MINLRKINKNDKDYFFKLNNNEDNAYWMRSDEGFTEWQFDAILKSTLVTWFVIYDIDKDYKMKKVGLFTIYLYGKRLYLGIIIEDQYRRQGYARKTFKHYLEVTDKEKVDTWLSTFSDQPALEMYKSLGFEKQSVEVIRGREHIHMKRRYKK